MYTSDIEKVIDHLPKGTIKIIISGGEPFVVKETLMHTLSYLDEKTTIGRIYVQTNGSWVTDENVAHQTLKELYELNVHALSWTGRYKFHEEQGLDIRKVSTLLEKAVVRLAKEKNTFPKDAIGVTKIDDSKGVMPLGRAKNLPQEELREKFHCSVPYDFGSTQHDFTYKQLKYQLTH